MIARQCPRCRQRSEGVSYLRQPRLLALLIGASVLTWGIGGLVVHGLRRRERYCPNCGVRWRAPTRVALGAPDMLPDDADRTPEQLAALVKLRRRAELSIRALRGSLHVACAAAAAGALYGVVIVTSDILDGHLDLVVHGLFIGTLAGGLFVGAWKSLEWVRPSVSQDHVRKVLKLAERGGGVLTATEVATQLGLGPDAAEELMAQMDDGFRVRSEVDGDGVVRYEFAELLHGRGLEQTVTTRRPATELEHSRKDWAAAAVDSVRMEPPASSLHLATEPFFAACTILVALQAAVRAADGDISGAALSGLLATFFAAMVLRWRKSDKKDRRSEIQARIDGVIELAERRRGILTASAVAAEPDLELTLDEAEQLLIALDDGSVVRSDISDEGVICYEFSEFLDRPAPA